MYLKQKLIDTISLFFALILFSLFYLRVRNIFFVYFALFTSLLLMFVWAKDYLNKKLNHRITITLQALYLSLFFVSIILFLKGIRQIYLSQFKIPDFGASHIEIKLVFIILLIAYIESIWKFTKKSLSRKYFNILFFITNISIVQELNFIYTKPRLPFDIASGGALLFGAYIALFFYLISLIIATVEFIRRRKSKTSDNPVVSNQQTAKGVF